MNSNALINNFYYSLRPFLPKNFQICLRRIVAKRKRKRNSANWPILPSAGKKPVNWPGWLNKKRFALVLTHDVETVTGRNNCLRIAQLEMDLGFRSSFNFVPKRYHVSETLRSTLSNAGFEIGVHGLYHDGKLFRSWSIFSQRAILINKYIKEWNACGFRAPAMHHNLNWMHMLEIKYDMSTFDTDPFEPQSDGAGTIFPFWVNSTEKNHRYLELPYTLPQDFTLFILLKENSIRIWKEKLLWIANNEGMALLDMHPDYVHFTQNGYRSGTYPVELYQNFLQHIKTIYEDQYWNILPRDMVAFYNAIHQDTF